MGVFIVSQTQQLSVPQPQLVLRPDGHQAQLVPSVLEHQYGRLLIPVSIIWFLVPTDNHWVSLPMPNGISTSDSQDLGLSLSVLSVLGVKYQLYKRGALCFSYSSI